MGSCRRETKGGWLFWVAIIVIMIGAYKCDRDYTKTGGRAGKYEYDKYDHMRLR